MSSAKKTSGKRGGRSPSRSGGGTLLGIFIGMMLGACIAAGAAWYFSRSNPFQEDVTSPRAKNSLQRPVTIPAKPGGQPVEKPQFDFYKILPEGNGSAPVDGRAASAPQTPPKPDVTGVKTPPDKPEAPTETLFLQVGAFESEAEAESVKARLAMMGIEASVQKVQTPDKGTLSRVRVGPFSKPEDMGSVRAQLAQSGINAGVIRTQH